MLEYNKPLTVKDAAGNELFTIKNLTLDAEFELERIGYILKTKQDELLDSGKYAQITNENIKDTIEIMELSKKRLDKKLSEQEEIKIVKLHNKLLKKEEEDRKNGLAQLKIDDVLYKLDKQDLIDMVEWVRENIEGQDNLGYIDTARLLNNISMQFQIYKSNLKKK